MTRHAREVPNRANRPVSASQLLSPAMTVRAMADAFEALGYDRKALLAAARIEEAILADSDAELDCSAIPSLCDAAMRQRPIQNLGTRLAAATPIGAYALFDYLIVTAETAGAALRQLSRYLKLTGVPYLLTFDTSQDAVRVQFEESNAPFSVEYGLTLSLLHLRTETGGAFQAQCVYLAHQPEDAAQMQALFGCPVIGNASWEGFTLSPECWELPMRRRDPILRDLLERQVPEAAAAGSFVRSAASDIRRVLAARMAEGDIQIGTIARALATSTRSLQRRLAAEGVSYQQVLDDARRSAASRYLTNSALSVTDVAYLLGYSEATAFHRAFKRWHGMTPQAYRQHRRSRTAPFHS